MQLKKVIFTFLLLVYYISYFNPVTIIPLFIGALFLFFIFFIDKKFNLLNLFYVILPSIFKLNLNQYDLVTGVNFFFILI